MESNRQLETVIKIMSVKLKNLFIRSGLGIGNLQEIRLRAGGPLLLHLAQGEYFLTAEGKLTKKSQEAYIVSRNEIRETMEYISNYSLYAFEEEVRQGYITLAGGHRVGIGGRVVLEQNKIKSMKYISFLNIRFAHQVKGCADPALPFVRKGGTICHTLFVAPPGCGKTTMLRDAIRQLSDGGMTVGVVDERSEIAACYLGIPQNDIGIRTDVLDCCPKAEGMLLLVRSMSPEIIAVDEIGKEEDLYALQYAISCGCKLMATVHGNSLSELSSKPVLSEMIRQGLFERYLVLEKKDGACRIREALDGQGKRL